MARPHLLNVSVVLSLAFVLTATLALPLASPAARAALATASPDGFLEEIVVLDRFGRRLNEHGLTLVDWEGQIANPAIRISIVPPTDTTFPATAIVSCPQARLYFDEPSTAGASGPAKTLKFPNSTPVPLPMSIFPDRDGADEDWPITVQITSANGASRILIFNAHVIDQDQPTRPVEFPITIDFSRS